MKNIIACVIPITSKNNIDWNNFKFLINYFIFNKINNILILGTTSESQNYIVKNYFQIFLFLKKFKINFIFGICKNNILSSYKIAFYSKINNIKAILITQPYYILPKNIGIFKYFKILSKIGLPIVFYFIPKRIGNLIKIKILKLLKKLKIFFCIKISLINIKFNYIFKKKINCFCYSGNDENLFLSKLFKFNGTISVLNNNFPKMFNFLNFKNIYFIKHFSLNINPLFIKYVMFKNKLINFNLLVPLIGINFFFFTQSQT